ncbi:LamG domain-containing protein [Archangium violaceum]|uniref:LamG domain-containing protein n=1 Tax=Archangium violaceum TaxID=83451 RepID=UPI00193B5EB0|nr:LamG domain-containing protein [Archangium violaceum]QRK06881.1 LamG domain-containing protein [Archangium violaceum]
MKHLKWTLAAAIAVLLPGMRSEAVPIRVTNGLVGEWKQTIRLLTNELAPDTSGLGQTGNVSGGRASSYGWSSSGMDLSGDKYIRVSNSPSLNFGTGSFTLSAWIRMSDTSRSIKTLIDNRGSDGRGYAFSVYQGNSLLLQLADETGWINYTSDGTVPLVPNRWHHVAVSVDRTSWPVHIAFYIDGYQAGLQTPKMGNINNTDLPFLIGGHKDSSFSRFNDRIDEVLVYNRALPKWEVWNVLNPGRPSFEPSYWNGNDRQGSNNCYNYTNNKATNTFAQPGKASGNQATVMDCAVVRQAAINDGLEPISDYPSTLLNFKSGAALVVAPGYDYHWYRLDENGTWSHKPGGTPATNLDNSGNVITDPRTANRGPYTQFCGFFMIWSDIAEGYGHENIQ